MKKLLLFLTFLHSALIFGADISWTELPDEVKLQIFSDVLAESDFDKALTHFDNIRFTSKDFNRIANDEFVKNDLMTKAMHGDFNTVTHNLNRLLSNSSFKDMSSELRSIIEIISPAEKSASQHFSPYQQKVILALLLGTPQDIKYLKENEATLTNLMNNFQPVSQEDWQKNFSRYRKMAKTLKSVIDPDKNPHIFFYFLSNGVRYNDHIILNIILENTHNFDITSLLQQIARQISKDESDCEKALEIIVLLLEKSRNFKRTVIKDFDGMKSKGESCNKIITMLQDLIPSRESHSSSRRKLFE